MSQSIKVSIITVVKDGMPFLEECLESVKYQTFKNIEHIIIYSPSNDLTEYYLKKRKNIRLIKQKKNDFKGKIYDALNIGLKHSTGDLIGILHSDDIYYDKDVIKKIVNAYKKNKFDICYGNLLICKKNNLKRVVRRWIASRYINLKIYLGWMPPHPTIFINKKYKHIKYNINYKISSDYDYILKIFDNKKKIYFLNEYFTVMRVGGISSQNINTLFLKSYEDLRILKNLFYFGYLILALKILIKVPQYIFYNYPNSFFRKNDKIYKKIIDKKTLVTSSYKVLLKKKKFILSAFNLAYVSFVHNKINVLKNHLIIWPDGIFSSLFINKKKISGRKLLNIIRLPKNNCNIYILGKKDLIIKNYIKNKYPFASVNSIYLPYLNANNLIKSIKKTKLNILPNSFFIIYLPTPKQEIIASYILNNYLNAKIFCFGGAVYDNSRNIKPPHMLIENYFEFLWRLRNDTLRRINRLLLSAILLLKKILTNDLDFNVK